ncbi:MAG: hypothetical protein IKO26_00105 [Paludibacteraceae bacterium]|nr:hypothetical protein [Paludibacteraceae bacterium]
MKIKQKKYYDTLSDQQLIDMICAGNEEAANYIIYNRYYRDMRYWCRALYKSEFYLGDLCGYMLDHLKGDESDWARLKSWKGKSSFRTWFSKITRNFFIKKRPDLIDSFKKRVYNGEGKKGGDIGEDDSPGAEKTKPNTRPSPKDNMDIVLLLEAINTLKNKEYKFVLMKELEKYSHAEIAEMINKMRAEEGTEKRNEHGVLKLVTSKTVDVMKQHAKEQIRKAYGII